MSNKLRYIAILIVIILFFLLSFHSFMSLCARLELYPEGDSAVLEIYTLHAARLTQLLGPYSRFNWNHPGPALFYIFSLFYQLCGHCSLSLNLSSFLLNMMAALGILLITYRMGGPFLFYWSTLLVAIYMLYLSFPSLISPWNPTVTILPFGLFVFLSAALSVGCVRALPAGIAIASFVVQTHIAYLPDISVIFIISLILYAFPQLRKKMGLKGVEVNKPLLWFIVSFLILTVMWMPSILEQIYHHPGNLSNIYRCFESGETLHLSEVFIPVSKQIAALPLFLFGVLLWPVSESHISVAAGLITALQIVLLSLAYSIGIRQQRNYCAALCLLGGVGLLIAIFSMTRIIGPVHLYLVSWTSMIGLINWVAIGGVVLAYITSVLKFRGMRLFIQSTIVGLIILVTAGSFIQLRQHPLFPTIREHTKVLFEALQKYLEENAIKSPIIRIYSEDSWPVAAGVILQLYKADISFSIEECWVFMFGSQFATSSSKAEEILFGDRLFHQESRKNPFYRLVAQNADIFIYNSIGLTDIERYLYKGKVNVLRAIQTRGDPAVLVDGRIPPEGTVWNSDQCLILSDQTSSVTIEVPKNHIEGLIVSADNNDSYSLSCSTDGSEFTEIGIIPIQAGAGMRVRIYFNENLSSCKFLKISPCYGDGSFSIGEIGFITSEALKLIETITNKRATD